ncbi:hypothetical protein NPIL_249891 [Nephila pilipes]|uniref:Uncharacterized protein n=1 Tax=Nephila pilipes TaxID=299642 RepID=A0A8X6QAB0_NEPPI|nr:hypothetical protein NPIL_249891 [Nephila pilipes]
MRIRKSLFPRSNDSVKSEDLTNQIDKSRRPINAVALKVPPKWFQEVIRHEYHHKDIRVHSQRNVFHPRFLFLAFRTSKGEERKIRHLV